MLKQDVMFVAGGRKLVGLRRIVLAPGDYETLFLVLDRPPDGRIGEQFDLQITQRDSEDRQIMADWICGSSCNRSPRRNLKPSPSRPHEAARRQREATGESRHGPQREAGTDRRWGRPARCKAALKQEAEQEKMGCTSSFTA